MYTNYYIFSIADQKKGSLKTNLEKNGQEVFKELVLDKNIWGFGLNTPNRKAIKIGDKILFYLTGLDNQVFLGGATIDSLPEVSDDKSEWYSEKYPLRIKLKDVFKFDHPKKRKDILGLEWIPNQGGSSRITEADYLLISKGLKSNVSVNRDETEFALEKYLEEFIITNWDKINFGEDLTLFKDENGNIGKQYLAGDIGYIDILAQDKANTFVVIELKKGQKNDEVVGQTLRYLSWVQENLSEGNNVRGIIIVGAEDKKLEYSVRQVSDKIKVFKYHINFSLESI